MDLNQNYLFIHHFKNKHLWYKMLFYLMTNSKNILIEFNLIYE